MTTRDGSQRWTLGQQICYWRGRRKLSREELAARAGLSEDGIASVEQGRRPNPGFFTVAKIAAALKISLDRLLTDPKPVDW
jgi:transcriptional regulator with XRE-family HTH domain